MSVCECLCVCVCAYVRVCVVVRVRVYCNVAVYDFEKGCIKSPSSTYMDGGGAIGKGRGVNHPPALPENNPPRCPHLW